MLCICDAKNTTLLLYGRTKEAGVYIGCYDVIPGRDQESNQWVFTVLRSHCAVIKIRSLVLARDDESRAQCCICGCKLFIRQKNIRTKEFIEYSNVCSSELDVHLSFQCFAPMVR